jgi:hypothetical protein
MPPITDVRDILCGGAPRGAQRLSGDDGGGAGHHTPAVGAAVTRW